MSLDKSIEHGKDKRKPYYGSKAVDRSCRNHGSCDYCRNNREFKTKKREDAAAMRIREATLSDEDNL